MLKKKAAGFFFNGKMPNKMKQPTTHMAPDYYNGFSPKGNVQKRSAEV